MWTFKDDCTELIQPSLTFKASYSCKLLSLSSPLILFKTILNTLKGVFAKNERGYWLNAIKKRF